RVGTLLPEIAAAMTKIAAVLGQVGFDRRALAWCHALVGRDADVVPVDLDAVPGQAHEHRLADQSPGHRVHRTSDLHVGVRVDLRVAPQHRLPALTRKRDQVFALDLEALRRATLSGPMDASVGDLVEPAAELDAELADVEHVLAGGEKIVLDVLDRRLDLALLLGGVDGSRIDLEAVKSG